MGVAWIKRAGRWAGRRAQAKGLRLLAFHASERGGRGGRGALAGLGLALVGAGVVWLCALGAQDWLAGLADISRLGAAGASASSEREEMLFFLWLSPIVFIPMGVVGFLLMSNGALFLVSLKMSAVQLRSQAGAAEGWARAALERDTIAGSLGEGASAPAPARSRRL